MAHIEAKLALFQMIVKGLFMNASKAGKAHFAQPPKILNSVDVVAASCKLVFTVPNAVMSLISKIGEAIVGFESVGINDRVWPDFLPDNRQYFSHRAVFDDLRIDLAAAPEHAKYRHFTGGATSALTAHSAPTEVAFVQFHRALFKGADALAFLGDVLSDLSIQSVGRWARDAGDLSDFASLDIKAKQPQNLPEFLLRNSGTNDILVFHL